MIVIIHRLSNLFIPTLYNRSITIDEFAETTAFVVVTSLFVTVLYIRYEFPEI